MNYAEFIQQATLRLITTDCVLNVAVAYAEQLAQELQDKGLLDDATHR